MQLSLAQFQLPSQSPGVHLNAIALPPEASQTIPLLRREITMPKVSLSGMTVEALMDLRRRVDEMLHQHRAKLQQQLERIAVVGGSGEGWMLSFH